MAEENISQEFRLKKYRWNKKLLHWRNKRKWTDEQEVTLNCIKHFSAVIGSVSISAFASLVGISIAIASSGVVINVCAITARIEKYKSIVKKKNMKK